MQSLLNQNIEHPKISALASIIQEEFQKNSQSKIIVFTQFRETAALLVKKLSEIKNVRASIFIGQAKKESSSGLSQKEQKEIIEKFKSGELNVLVATSIGEEGLDLPEVSAVVFYEPIPSAIRKIQRAGRTARLSPGKLIILITQETRDVIHHYASSARERKMYKAVHSIKQELKEKNSKPKEKSINEFLDSSKSLSN